MRILFLSNFYPPHPASGGYDQLCTEVVQALESQGHSTTVLTSKLQDSTAPGSDDHVYRLLHLENSDLLHYQPIRFFTTRRLYEKRDLLAASKVMEAVQPDVVFVWGMWALSRTLPAYLERREHPPVAYYVADHWPASQGMHFEYWGLPARRWGTRLLKRWLARLAFRVLAIEGKPVKLRFEHVACVSNAVRTNLIGCGLTAFERARVIHNGIDLEQLPPSQGKRHLDPCDGALKMLYAGRLVREKGVHTALEAVAELVHREGMDGLHLTIVGSGDPAYETWLKEWVVSRQIGKHVVFREAVPRDQMLVNRIFPVHAAVLRTAVVREVGGFDESLTCVEDWDFWLRVTAKYTMGYLPKPLARYRVYPGSMSTDAHRMFANAVAVINKYFGPPQGDVATWSGDKRKAYGFTFRGAAFGFIAQRQRQQGLQLLGRAVECWPGLLDRVDTFYEWACGEQMRGYRGQARVLNLDSIAIQMLQELSEIFKCVPIAQPKRAQALGNAYLALAMLSDQCGFWCAARNYMLKAARINPPLLLSSYFMRRLLKLCLGMRMAGLVRRLLRHSRILQ